MLVHPFEASAVHDAALGVSEKVEHPKGVAGPPVAFIAVKDNMGIWSCTEAGHKFFECFAVEIVADEGIIEVEGPIDFEGTGDVTRRIEKGVLV